MCTKYNNTALFPYDIKRINYVVYPFYTVNGRCYLDDSANRVMVGVGLGV